MASNQNYTDLYKYFYFTLDLLSEEYEDLYLESFVLFYNICHDESILRDKIVTITNNKN